MLATRAFHYDANGRMDCRGASTSACTGGNRIEWFVGGGVREVNNGPLKSVFTYGGPERRRVRHTVSHASLPNAAQNRTITYVGAHFEVETEQAGRDGSGLTPSEQEGLKNYLDAYARTRGTSGGVIFFGNRSQMGLLGETGGARALLKDRRSNLSFVESMLVARTLATTRPSVSRTP